MKYTFLAIFIFLLIPFESQAVQIINTFDSMENHEQVRGQTGFSFEESSGAILSSNAEAITLPNAIGSLGTGASNYLYALLGHTDIGIMQAIVWSAGGDGTGVINMSVTERTGGLDLDVVNLYLVGDDEAELQVNGTPVHTFSVLPLSTWTNVFVEWRSGGSYLEFRARVGTETSDWYESTIALSNSDSRIRLNFIDACCTFNTARLDNFFLQTDGDIPPPPEGQTWLNIDYPFEGGNTASTSFDIGFTYTLDERVEGAEEFPYIRFTLCSLFYQNEPCVTESYETTFGITETATTSINSTWEGYSLLIASFWNGVETDVTCPWWNFLCQEAQVKIGASDSIKLNIATTTIDADVPDWIQNADLCTTFGDIGNGFCQAMVFLFYPSDIASQSINEIRDILAQKQPFGFFFLVSKQMDSLFKTEGATGTGLTISLGPKWGTWEVFNFATAKSKVVAMGLYTQDVVDVINIFLYISLISYWWFRLTGKQEDIGDNTWQRGV